MRETNNLIKNPVIVLPPSHLILQFSLPTLWLIFTVPALHCNEDPAHSPQKRRRRGEERNFVIWLLFAQSLSRIQLFGTPWTAACQASLSFTISQTLLKFMSIESVMLSDHLILCYPLLLLPSIFLSIRVFSNQSALCNR